ncbi:MAG TPA: YihY/virulence factor BrkB family protein [Usitatibacter sp.]|nr:YihY/virulence factor BrkB family protein [Usitatibacter sp.]
MTFADIRQLLKDSISGWLEDYAPSMGAALSYYTIFSIAPLLVIVIAIAGLAFGSQAASGAIFEQLRGMVGDTGAAAVQGLVLSASKPAASILAGITGLLTLVLGATTVLGELQSALDRIWRAPPSKEHGVRKAVRAKIAALSLILAIGFLLLTSLVLSAALVALGTLWGEWFGKMKWLLEALNFVVSFVVVTALFGMIYKILPRVRIGWRDVWTGAAVTALLFTIGKFLIGLYLGKSGVTSGFGAAGSVVVLLVWVYYSAQIFLLGAEFTAIYTYRYGSLRGQARPEANAIPLRKG